MAVARKGNDTKQILYIADTGHSCVLGVEVEKGYPGNSPLHVWAQFKAALWTDDLDKALTFVADIAVEKYKPILEAARPEFQDMVTAMGDMTLVSLKPNVARYEMRHPESRGVWASFPVYFCLNSNGTWKIYCF